MSCRVVVYLTAILMMVPGIANAAPRNDRTDMVRELARRVGQVVGAASACRDIASPGIEAITDKVTAVIRHAGSDDGAIAGLLEMFDRSVADGRLAVAGRALDCAAAEHDFTDLEGSVGAAPASVPVPAAAPPRNVQVAAVAPFAPSGAVRGVSDEEIRFGMAMPLAGPVGEAGRQLRLGIETAFERANDGGGVHGRRLKLIVADAAEPTLVPDAMKRLYENAQVFGVVGNVGTETAAASLPYALERRMLFFAPFTGAALIRQDPPDRYVFNYRAGYGDETAAAVRYLVKERKLRPAEIAVFAQQGPFGDAGVAGVDKAVRALRGATGGVLRLGYKRNTVDVQGAVNQLGARRGQIKAVVMVATCRVAAKFIEMTRDLDPSLIYTNVSAVDADALAEELMVLGPQFAADVIVTQVVPPPTGRSAAIREYRSALGRYFPAEAPAAVSLEGYVAASILVEALRRAGPQLDTEKLVDTIESMRDLDLGLGTPVSFSRAEHQGSHKVWGARLDETGRYQTFDLD
jgi:branched-chain amino acid transport system substrate-binding protein